MNDARKSKTQLITELQTLRTKLQKKSDNVDSDSDIGSQYVLNTLASINEHILSQTNLNDLLDTLSNEIVAERIFRSLTICLVNHKTQHLQVIRRAHRAPNTPPENQIKINRQTYQIPLKSQNIVSQVAQTGKMQIIDGWDERFLSDVPISEVPDYPDLSKYEDKVSYFIPITQGNTTIAVFATGSSKSEKPNMLQYIKTLQPLFGQLAVAIRYAQLYEQVHQQAHSLESQVATQTQTLQETNRFLQAIDTIGQTMTSSLDLDEILDTLTEQIVKAGLFRSLAIAMVTEHHIEFLREYYYKTPEGQERSIRVYDSKISKTSKDAFAVVARTGDLLVIEDGMDERLEERYDWGDKIAYFIPVKTHAKTIAVLGTASTSSLKQQTLHRIKTLQPLLDQVAIALHHAQLHLATKEQTQIQDMCLHISHAVQKMVTKDDLYEVLTLCLAELQKWNTDICSLSVHRIDDLSQGHLETFRVDQNGKLDPVPEKSVRPKIVERWDEKQTLHVSDFSKNSPNTVENFRSKFNQLPIESFIDIPFERGVLSVHSLSTKPFSQKDQNIIQAITDTLSLGLTRVEDLNYLQDHNSKQNALLQINRAIQSMLQPKDLEKVIHTIYDQLHLCKINFVGLVIHHIREKNSDFVETYHIRPDGTFKKRQEHNEGPYQDWLNGEIIYRPNINQNPQGLSSEYTTTIYEKYNLQIQSMLNIPFSHGVFVLRSDAVAAFSQQDIRFIEQIVEILSLGISRSDDLTQKEAQYQELEDVYRYTPIALFMIDRDLRLLRFNQRLAELNGLKEQDLGRTLYEIIPDQIQTREKHFKNVFESAKPALYVKLQGHTPQDPKTLKTWLASYYPLKSKTGEVDRILGAVVDITELENTQEKLKKSEAQLLKSETDLRQILADVPIGIILTDSKAMIKQTNPAALELLGLTEDELLGKTALDPYWNVIDEDGVIFAQEDFPIPTAIRTGQSVNNVYMGVYRPKTQDRIDLLVNAEVQKDNAGQVQTVVCSFMNITELKQTTKALQESKNLLNQAQNMAHLGSWTLDVETHQVHLSDELCKIYGFELSENVTTFERILEIVHPNDQQSIRDNTQNMAKAGIGEHTEFRIVRPNGDIIYLYSQAQAITNSEGQTTSLIGIVQDITTQKQLDAERQHTQRLRALGEMAAGISHNLNNLLTGILGPAQMLQITQQDPQIQEEIDTILTAGLRARDIVQRLNKGWRTDNETLEPININQVIQEAIRTTRPRWKDEPESRGIYIDLIPHLTNDISPIQGTQAELNDIIVNMIFNAVDAMPKGGKIALTTTQTTNYVRLLISDTGTGMSAETLERIFDPFFTTKGEVGTGLGLSTVYGTIKRWGGNISVTSTLKKGTTFTLDFVIAQDDTHEVPIRQQHKYTNNKGRILLVEDEEVVARVLSRALSLHHIDIVTSGPKALELFKPNQYDILITDLGLPHLSGDQLAQKLREQDPTLITILVSGWDLLPNDPRRKDFNFFVQKPFHDLDHFRQMITDALNIKKTTTPPKSS